MTSDRAKTELDHVWDRIERLEINYQSLAKRFESLLAAANKLRTYPEEGKTQ